MLLLLALLAGCSTAGAPTRSPSASAAAIASQNAARSLPADFPAGSWTTTITEADLRAAGMTATGELAENTGSFTMTLDPNGTWTTTQRTDTPIRWPVFRGTWEATGPSTFRQRTDFPTDFAGDVVDFTWQLVDGELVLKVPSPPDAILPLIVETHPWQKAP
jgi:hypothetical protein